MDLISRAELFNRLATVKAPPEANEYKTEVYKIIQSMGTPGYKFGKIARCTKCGRETIYEWEDLEYICDRCGSRLMKVAE